MKAEIYVGRYKENYNDLTRNYEKRYYSERSANNLLLLIARVLPIYAQLH